MDKISPIVLTSKLASDHMNTIIGQHADILNEMRDQSIRVLNYNQNKMMVDKEKASLDAESNQKNVENIRKEQELELKRQALMS